MQRTDPYQQFANYLEKANAGDNHACYQVAQCYEKGTGVRRNNLAMLQWYKKAYQLGFSMYKQSIIIDFLIQFCRDPRYNPDKTRFNWEALNALSEGQCAGLTARFLSAAYLEKNKIMLDENSQLEEKAQPHIDSTKDDLKQFYHQLDTILGWNGERALTPAEQKDFFSFLYLMFGYQNTFFFESVPLYDLASFVFINNEKQSFKRELGCTFLLREQTELAKKIDEVRRPNRLIVIGIPIHSTGVYENYYFDSNCFEKNKQFLSSQEIASAIFKEIKELPKYQARANDPICFTIDIYAHVNEPIKVSYPTYAELLADSATSPTPDPYYGRTALHQAALHGHIESVLHFLLTIPTNKKDVVGFTALHLAVEFGHVSCVEVLLKQKDCHPNLQTHLKRFTPLMFAAYSGQLECAKLLIAHSKCDIQQTDFHNKSAFHIACENNHLDVARLLLARGYELSLWDKAQVIGIDKYRDSLSRNIVQLIKEKNENEAYRKSKSTLFSFQFIRNEARSNILAPRKIR